MSSKINITSIISDHLKTLHVFKSENVSKLDITVFYVIPLIVSALIVYAGAPVNKDLYSILSTSFSIFAALLFSLLAIIYMLHQYLSTKKDKNVKNKKTVLYETFSNVSYCILLCIVSVVAIISASVTTIFPEELEGVIIYYFSIHFLLTLVMVLKRMHLLIADDVGS